MSVEESTPGLDGIFDDSDDSENPATDMPTSGLGDLFEDASEADDIEDADSGEPVSPPEDTKIQKVYFKASPVITPSSAEDTPRDAEADYQGSEAGYVEEIEETETVGEQQSKNQTVEHSSSASPAERMRWRSEIERLWPSVEHVLRIAGASPSLDPVRSRLLLTQDVEEDAIQRTSLMDALRPNVSASGAVEAFRSREDIEPVSRFVYDEMLGISVLGDLWRDPEITEIMVDGWDRIVVERAGKLHLTERSFHDKEHAASIARSLALRISDRAVSNAIPLVSAELPQARIAIAYGPVVKGGLSITIRKFKKLIGLEGLKSLDAINDDMAHFLQQAVQSRATILVSGGTGAGKTTIINLLSAFIPDDERVITIEDAFELQLSNTHVVSLQTKEAASADDTVSVTLAELLRSTLRMRPDRIVVGEIREPEAAEVMLAAANTGHAGTMTTIHANSPDSALNERLVDLLLQMRPGNEKSVLRTIEAAFDLVVQVSRGKDGSRYVSSIALVDGLSPEGRVLTVPVFSAYGDRASRNFIKEQMSAEQESKLRAIIG